MFPYVSREGRVWAVADPMAWQELTCRSASPLFLDFCFCNIQRQGEGLLSQRQKPNCPNFKERVLGFILSSEI